MRQSRTLIVGIKLSRAANLGRACDQATQEPFRQKFSLIPHSKRGTAMDWKQVEGNWKQVKGKVKEQWGKLTDDDLDQIDGKREQLEGKLQERYGYAKDQTKKEVDDWYGTSWPG